MEPSSFLAVAKDRVIGLRYIMRNRYNEMLEDRMSGDPVFYLQGGDKIMPAMQMQLEALRPGQKKRVNLYMEEGSQSPDFVFEVEIFSVRPATGAELRLGYPLPVAGDCGPDCDCYNDSTGLANEETKQNLAE